LPSGRSKISLRRGRFSDVPRGRLALITHFLPSIKPKNATWAGARKRCL
jgi:hypothetical protein